MQPHEYIGKLVSIKHQPEHRFTVVDSYEDNLVLLKFYDEPVPNTNNDTRVASHVVQVNINAVDIIEAKGDS